MTLRQATIVATLVYAMIQLAVLPATRFSARQAATPGAVLRRLSLLAGLSFLRGAALVAALVYGVLLVTFCLLAAVGYADPHSFARGFMEDARKLSDLVGTIEEWWGCAIIGALAIPFALILRTSGRELQAKEGNAVAMLLQSESLAAAMGKGSAWLSRVSLALFFVLTLGVAVKDDGPFARKMDELAVSWTRQDKPNDVRQVPTSPPIKVAGEPPAIVDEGELEETINLLARSFEGSLVTPQAFAFAPKYPWIPGRPPAPDPPPQLSSASLPGGPGRATPEAGPVTRIGKPVTPAGKMFRKQLRRVVEELLPQQRTELDMRVQTDRSLPKEYYITKFGTKLFVAVAGKFVEVNVSDSPLKDHLSGEILGGFSEAAAEPVLERFARRAVGGILDGGNPGATMRSVAGDMRELRMPWLIEVCPQCSIHSQPGGNAGRGGRATPSVFLFVP